MSLTIDASVFIAASRSAEPHYVQSQEFIAAASSMNEIVICPLLVLPECSAAIARRVGNVAVAAGLITQIQTWPNIQLVSLTAIRAQRAADIAMQNRLRGADAIYVAVAEEYAATLVTWDNEMLQRIGNLVTVMTPADWLSQQPITTNTT